MGLFQGVLSGKGYTIELLRSAASFSGRLAIPRFDESLLLPAVQPGVDRADSDIPGCRVEQLQPYGDAIGTVPEAKNRQEKKVFETPENIGRRHLNCSVVLRRGTDTSKGI